MTTPLARRLLSMGSAIGLACTLPACSRSDARTNIDLYAASSLTTAMTSMAEAFENAEPNIRIVLNFAGSATLVEQIKQGAPADVVVPYGFHTRLYHVMNYQIVTFELIA